MKCTYEKPCDELDMLSTAEEANCEGFIRLKIIDIETYKTRKMIVFRKNNKIIPIEFCPFCGTDYKEIGLIKVKKKSF